MQISVLKNVFERNDNAAAENRAAFDRLGITCVNILSGAGAGKTTLLESLIPLLAPSRRVGVLEGDVATTRDAERIARLGVPVTQLLTDGGCHLTATLVQHALAKMPMDRLDLLIVENVGNPICPANFDLGEHLRMSVLSVTEGDDKPSKYPLLFKAMQAVVISKCDLLPHTDFDMALVRQDIARVNSDAQVIETSAKTGAGMPELAAWLVSQATA